MLIYIVKNVSLFSEFKEIILNILYVIVEKFVNILGIMILMCLILGFWVIIWN